MPSEEPQPSESPSEEPTETPSEEPTDQPSGTPEPTETPTQPQDATTPPADAATEDESEILVTLEVEPAEVLHGGEVTITADGFQANEAVEITLNPILTTVEADNDGRFSAAVTIPDDTEPGKYALTVTGLTSGNWGEVPITVLAPSAEGGIAKPSATDEAPTIGDIRGELATTGANASGLIAVTATLMLLVSTMLIVLHRRRAATLIDD